MKKIGVTVNLPTTAEGKAALNEAVVAMNSMLLAFGLNKVEAPREAKLAYLKSLHGVPPWANNQRRESE